MSTSKLGYNRYLLILGALLGFFAVILGAYGAHGLKGSISTESLDTFETGVRFQMYHALFALLIGSFKFISPRRLKLIFYSILVGVIFFSGSIYGLATNDLTPFDFTSIALITPVGGLLLIFSWALLLINLLKIKRV